MQKLYQVEIYGRSKEISSVFERLTDGSVNRIVNG